MDKLTKKEIIDVFHELDMPRIININIEESLEVWEVPPIKNNVHLYSIMG